MQATKSEDKQAADKAQDGADVVAAETAQDHAQFSDAGTKPPVGTSAPDGAAHAPSASDQAFADGGGERGFNSSGGGAGGSGQPLPDDVKGKFEASLGTDLSGVRVHTDAKSSGDTKSAGAKAVAVGSDIHFAQGNYDPHGQQGQELLAHEVAHTVQQKHATPQAQHKPEHVAPATHGAEADADQAASAMVSGQKASVTPVAQQRPHAKEAEWMAPIRASLKSGDWGDVALRLNGLNLDDMYTVVKGFTLGQRNHVRGSAQVVMAGWPEHVTETIDKVAAENGETGNKAAADYYAGYERALAAAKSGKGSWSAVAQGLAGMSAWDQDDRLKKLDWFDLQAIRGATDNATLLAAIDKADTARAKAVLSAFDREVKAGQWQAACNHLHGMSDDDIHNKLRPLEPTTLMALKAVASSRVAPMIDQELHDRPKDQDPTKPEQVVDPVAVVAPLVAVPDFSGDQRTTKEAKAAGEWGGSSQVKGYMEQLAAQHAEKEADQQLAKAKEPKPDRAALVGKLTAQYLADLKMQWDKTINEYQFRDDFKKFSLFATGFCADVGNGALFSLRHMYLVNLNKADNTFAPEPLEPMIKGGGAPVRKFTNEFMRNFPGSPNVRFYNYEGHGVGDFKDSGYCLDLFMDQAGTNSDGFLPREIALQVIYNIAAHAAAVGADWQCCYNDFSVSEAARAKFGNKIAYSGVGEKTPGHNWHGPLNLHIHLDLVPLKSDGVEKKPNPVGNPVPNETH